MFLGIVLAVHLSMNGKVGNVLNNARVGNALFWCIGALGAIVIGVTGWQAGPSMASRACNPVLLTAGAIGACLVFAIGWLIPQVGAAGDAHAIDGSDRGRHGDVALRLAGVAGTARQSNQSAGSAGDGRRCAAGDVSLGC